MQRRVCAGEGTPRYKPPPACAAAASALVIRFVEVLGCWDDPRFGAGLSNLSHADMHNRPFPALLGPSIPVSNPIQSSHEFPVQLQPLTH